MFMREPMRLAELWMGFFMQVDFMREVLEWKALVRSGFSSISLSSMSSIGTISFLCLKQVWQRESRVTQSRQRPAMSAASRRANRKPMPRNPKSSRSQGVAVMVDPIAAMSSRKAMRRRLKMIQKAFMSQLSKASLTAAKAMKAAVTTINPVICHAKRSKKKEEKKPHIMVRQKTARQKPQETIWKGEQVQSGSSMRALLRRVGLDSRRLRKSSLKPRALLTLLSLELQREQIMTTRRRGMAQVRKRAMKAMEILKTGQLALGQLGLLKRKSLSWAKKKKATGSAWTRVQAAMWRGHLGCRYWLMRGMSLLQQTLMSLLVPTIMPQSTMERKGMKKNWKQLRMKSMPRSNSLNSGMTVYISWWVKMSSSISSRRGLQKMEGLRKSAKAARKRSRLRGMMVSRQLKAIMCCMVNIRGMNIHPKPMKSGYLPRPHSTPTMIRVVSQMLQAEDTQEGRAQAQTNMLLETLLSCEAVLPFLTSPLSLRIKKPSSPLKDCGVVAVSLNWLAATGAMAKGRVSPATWKTRLLARASRQLGLGGGELVETLYLPYMMPLESLKQGVMLLRQAWSMYRYRKNCVSPSPQQEPLSIEASMPPELPKRLLIDPTSEFCRASNSLNRLLPKMLAALEFIVTRALCWARAAEASEKPELTDPSSKQI